MKLPTIKRQLLREGGIIAAGLITLAGATYGLAMINDQYATQNRELENQVNGINSEINSLKEKFAKVKANTDLYQEVILKQENQELSLSRQALRQHFDMYKLQYFLGKDSRVNMPAIQEIKDPKYKRNTFVAEISEVTVGFDALTDEDIYGLLQSLKQELPGAVKITKFSIARQNSLTDATIRMILETGQERLVSGAIQFTWYGIKSVDNATNTMAGSSDAKPQ